MGEWWFGRANGQRINLLRVAAHLTKDTVAKYCYNKGVVVPLQEGEDVYWDVEEQS